MEATQATPTTSYLPLTPRELEVAHWIAEGKTNIVIAEVLGLSPYTVKNHVVSILAKIGGENRAAIAAYYCRNAHLAAA